MKKFIVMMIFAFIATFSINFCSANKDYYDNNSDYRLMWAHQGYYSYLYLPSIDVQEYNPPYYQIAYDYVSVNDRNEKESWGNGVKRFNWSTKESFHLENGRWVVDNVSGNLGPAIRNRYLADTIFRAAYNMDFYKQKEENLNNLTFDDYIKKFSRDDVPLVYCGEERNFSSYNLAVVGYSKIYFVVGSVRGSSRENFECIIKDVYTSTVHESQNRTQYISFKVYRRQIVNSLKNLVEEGLDFRLSNGLGGFFKFNDDVRNTREHGPYFNVYKEAIKYI